MAAASDSPSMPCVQRGISQTIKLLDRRGALGALTSAPVAASAVAADVGQDPHPEWYRRVRELGALEDSGTLDDDQGEAACGQRTELEDLALETPARTLPGVLAQLRTAVWLHDVMTAFGQQPTSDEMAFCGLRNTIATLEQLTGSASA